MAFEKEFKYVQETLSKSGILGAYKQNNSICYLNQKDGNDLHFPDSVADDFLNRIKTVETPENFKAYYKEFVGKGVVNNNLYRIAIRLDHIKVPKLETKNSAEIAIDINKDIGPIEKTLTEELDALNKDLLNEQHSFKRYTGRDYVKGSKASARRVSLSVYLDPCIRKIERLMENITKVSELLSILRKGSFPTDEIAILKDYQGRLHLNHAPSRLLAERIGGLLSSISKKQSMFVAKPLSSNLKPILEDEFEVNFHEVDEPSQIAGSVKPKTVEKSSDSLEKSLDTKQLLEQHDKFLNSLSDVFNLLNAKKSELNGVLTHQTDLDRAQQEKLRILADDKLSDYYYIFQIAFNDVFLASKTIHSGMVEHAPSSYDKASSIISNRGGGVIADRTVDIIKTIGRNIPFAGLFAEIFASALSAYSYHHRMDAVNRVANYLPGIGSCEELGEVLSRALTLAQIKEIQELPSNPETGFFKRNLSYVQKLCFAV